MENQPEVDDSFVPEYKDTMQSEYGAIKVSRDFGDKRIFPDIATLEAIHDYWNSEQFKPERSARAIVEIQKILGRVVFEIAARGGETRREAENLENAFQYEAYTPSTQQIFTAESQHSEQQAA